MVKNYLFSFQENQFWGSCKPCTLQEFNNIVDSAVVKWKIDMRQQVEAAIEEGKPLDEWTGLHEFKQFCKKRESEKRGDLFTQLTTEKKLLQWMQSLKESLPCFIFGVSEFELVTYIDKQGCEQTKRRRKMQGIKRLSGLFMWDGDHLPFDPRSVYERTLRPDFPWKVVLAHKTSSGQGLRLVCEVRPELGNIADNQIELSRELGLLGVRGTTGKPVTDDSCIDPTRISYAPRREDIYYIDEKRLFNSNIF